MEFYQNLLNNTGVKPITATNALNTSGLSLDSRQNYLTLANTVELVTETLMDIASRTDALSLELDGNCLIRDDVTVSVVRNLEARIADVNTSGE